MTHSLFHFSTRSPLLFFVLLVGALFVSGCRAQPADPPSELLCPTYCVGESFASFYKTHGGEVVFGEPISGVLEISRQEDIVTQYFESMRLDYDRESGQVSIPELGRWAFEGLPEEDREAMASRTFSVAEPFADFYSRYGGEDIFGQPLSPLMNDGALRVQYFANARLEWQPGLSTTSGLYSGSIGRAHFDQTAYAYDIVAQPLDPQQRLEQVNLSAVVAAPILYAGETQTFFVEAVSPAQVPADNLKIEIAVSQGDQTVTLSGTTDMDGRVMLSLSPQDMTFIPGERLQATIKALGAADTALGTHTISFESWW